MVLLKVCWDSTTEGAYHSFCPSQAWFCLIFFLCSFLFFFLDACLFSNGGRMWILEGRKVGRSWEELGGAGEGNHNHNMIKKAYSLGHGLCLHARPHCCCLASATLRWGWQWLSDRHSSLWTHEQMHVCSSCMTGAHIPCFSSRRWVNCDLLCHQLLSLTKDSYGMKWTGASLMSATGQCVWLQQTLSTYQ